MTRLATGREKPPSPLFNDHRDNLSPARASRNGYGSLIECGAAPSPAVDLVPAPDRPGDWLLARVVGLGQDGGGVVPGRPPGHAIRPGGDGHHATSAGLLVRYSPTPTAAVGRAPAGPGRRAP